MEKEEKQDIRSTLDAVGVSLQDQEISLFEKFTFFRRLKSKFEFYTREYKTFLVCVREFA